MWQQTYLYVIIVKIHGSMLMEFLHQLLDKVYYYSNCSVLLATELDCVSRLD